MFKYDEEKYTLADAISLARNIKYGPLPKKTDPKPTIDEAIGIITQERKTCGFNWLTGTKALTVLYYYKS